MTSKVTLEQVQALAAELSPGERATLAQWLLEQRLPAASAPRTDWMSVRGVAPACWGAKMLSNGCPGPGENRMRRGRRP